MVELTDCPSSKSKTTRSHPSRSKYPPEHHSCSLKVLLTVDTDFIREMHRRSLFRPIHTVLCKLKSPLSVIFIEKGTMKCNYIYNRVRLMFYEWCSRTRQQASAIEFNRRMILYDNSRRFEGYIHNRISDGYIGITTSNCALFTNL